MVGCFYVQLTFTNTYTHTTTEEEMENQSYYRQIPSRQSHFYITKKDRIIPPCVFMLNEVFVSFP